MIGAFFGGIYHAMIFSVVTCCQLVLAAVQCAAVSVWQNNHCLMAVHQWLRHPGEAHDEGDIS